MKKKILFILTFLLAFMPMLVGAKVTEFGDNVNLTESYDSSKFVFGSDVNFSGDIDGIGVLFGNTMIVNGKASYGVYFGNSLTIGGEVEKDLFIFGNFITISESAIIPRDAYVFGSNVVLKTDIGRDLYIFGETIDLRGVTISGKVNATADNILLDQSTTIVGSLTYNEDATLSGVDKATIGELIEVESTETVIDTATVIKTWIYNALTNLVCLLVILLVFPKIKKVLNEYKVESGNTLLSIGLGFGALIIVPIVAIAALLCEVTIPLSLIVLALYFISMYVGWLYASYIIGKKIWSLLKKQENMFVEGIIGVIVVELAVIIPYFGGIIEFLVFIFGIGLFLYQFKNISFLNK